MKLIINLINLYQLLSTLLNIFLNLINFFSNNGIF